LPDYIEGLLAAFALMGSQKRDESEGLLNQLSLSWTAQKGFKPSSELMSKIHKILKDPEVGGKALEIANLHAYRTTAVLDILRWARWMGGVLAPAYFLWLRGHDRTLWYALNNLGRRSFHSEGAGAIAHYMAEQNAKKPLPIPRIDTAIVTLNQYMSSPNAAAIPPREGDKKSQRKA
jgi:intracellular multiplication protein IcmP